MGNGNENSKRHTAFIVYKNAKIYKIKRHGSGMQLTSFCSNEREQESISKKVPERHTLAYFPSAPIKENKKLPEDTIWHIFQSTPTNKLVLTHETVSTRNIEILKIVI